ncbi:hypothetical protein J6590_092145 [Homalodisca vitripennis]|nr:hypothetical protein J6590_092145 [Homalodisca vitripennis]
MTNRKMKKEFSRLTLYGLINECSERHLDSKLQFMENRVVDITHCPESEIESSERSKCRKTEELRKLASSKELTFAASMSQRAASNPVAADLTKTITETPTSAKEIKELLSKAENNSDEINEFNIEQNVENTLQAPCRPNLNTRPKAESPNLFDIPGPSSRPDPQNSDPITSVWLSVFPPESVKETPFLVREDLLPHASRILRCVVANKHCTDSSLTSKFATKIITRIEVSKTQPEELPIEQLRVSEMIPMEEDRLLLSEGEDRPEEPKKKWLSRGKLRKRRIEEAVARGEPIIPRKERQKRWEEKNRALIKPHNEAGSSKRNLVVVGVPEQGKTHSVPAQKQQTPSYAGVKRLRSQQTPEE